MSQPELLGLIAAARACPLVKVRGGALLEGYAWWRRALARWFPVEMDEGVYLASLLNLPGSEGRVWQEPRLGSLLKVGREV